MRFHGEESGTPDDGPPAGGAAGMIPRMVRDVSHVRVTQPPPHRRLPGPFQCRHRRRRQVPELIVGMETGEVERDVGSDLAQDPVDQAEEHLLGIVERRDDEVDDLEMGAAPGDLLDAPENRLQLRAADIPVERLVVSLQVDLDCVQDLAEFGQRRLVHDSATDHYGTDSVFFRFPGDVDHILREDRRLVVREGDHRRLFAGRGRHDAIRGDRGPLIILRGGLGYLPVLAELAAQRTPCRGQRVGRRAGKEVVEGLLLDRVDMDADRPAVDEALQFAADVHPGAAAAAFARLDDATLSAEKAFDDFGFMPLALPREKLRGDVARAAIIAGQRHGGPKTGPGGQAHQVGSGIEGEEKTGVAARKQALPEWRGEAQTCPAEDRGDPGQRSEKSPSGDHGRLLVFYISRPARSPSWIASRSRLGLLASPTMRQ